MEQDESRSTTQKNEEVYQAHTLLRDRWNGRSGYTVYFLPVPKDKVREYISNTKIRLTPQCGDSISYIKEVEAGEELKKERGTHNLPRVWKAPVKGCEVKIQKYSCS